MPEPDFTLEFIKDQSALVRFVAVLENVRICALDIETADWWNRHRERVALIQIAFRQNTKIKVAVIDALAEISLEVLRPALESESVIKVIHNASFDATRLEKHYNFQVSPVFDTMLAARRAGEKKYSLKAQAQIHLNIQLDKSAQTSDWSRRPLTTRQLYYAARDPLATLLLSEHQQGRNLNGRYFSKSARLELQNVLPLGESLFAHESPADEMSLSGKPETENESLTLPINDLSEPAIALLGIITELPTRYSPGRLAVSLEVESRVGLAGWMVDRRLGKETVIDEESVKIIIAELVEKRLIRVTESRRLEATTEGANIWRENYKDL